MKKIIIKYTKRIGYHLIVYILLYQVTKISSLIFNTGFTESLARLLLAFCAGFIVDLYIRWR